MLRSTIKIRSPKLASTRKPPARRATRVTDLQYRYCLLPYRYCHDKVILYIDTVILSACVHDKQIMSCHSDGQEGWYPQLHRINEIQNAADARTLFGLSQVAVTTSTTQLVLVINQSAVRRCTMTALMTRGTRRTSTESHMVMNHVRRTTSRQFHEKANPFAK